MGTTSEKLTYLNTTKSNIKDSIELMGTTILSEDTFRSYADKIKNQLKLYLKENSVETLWNNWEKVSGSGETLTLNNTMEGKMKVDLKGNTYQYSTTGKNKLSSLSTEIDTTINGIKFTSNNGLYTMSGTTSSAQAFTGYLSINNEYTIQSGDYLHLMNNVVSASDTFILQFTDSTSYSPTLNTANRIVDLSSYVGKTLNKIGLYVSPNTTTNVIMTPMIVNSSSATSWEEYTGGQPSPNPDYPQDIQVVSGDNTIKVEGKNLFNTNIGNYTISNDGTYNYDTDRLTCDYERISGNKITFSQTSGSGFFGVAFYDSNKNYISRYISGGVVLSITSDIPNNAVYARAFIQLLNREYANVQSISKYKMMLELGNTATTYTPYVSQTYPISLGNIELCKIGTYQDYIRKSTGKNLFDKSSATQGYYYNASLQYTSISNTQISDYIKVNSGEDYTISYTKTSNNETTIRINYFNGNKEIQQQITDISTTSGYRTYTFTIPNNIEYVRFSTTTNQIYIDQNTIQINKGQTALPYEPYGKVWYLHKEIGKVVLDGSEMWNLRTDISYSDIAAFRDNDYVAGSVITNSTSVCNYFTPLTSQQNAVGLRLIDVNNYGYQVQVPKTIASTIAEFKIWITNHNLIIYHPLATPTNTEITDSSLLNQLNNLYNANSYDGTTNVSQVNDDLASILNVTALEDIS